MRILTYITTQEDAGRAVRSVAPRRFHLGEHAFRRLKVQHAVLLDGMPVRANHILAPGQTLQIRLDNGIEPPQDTHSPQGVSALIRYIDSDMIIACKGAPLATLPCAHIKTGTLREQLAAALGEDAASFCFHPVNRLDKGTSGLLCVARHAHAQRLLSAQLHTGGFVREYLAVTQGVPKCECGTIDAPIARLGAGARRGILPNGRHAVTHYRVERASAGRALVRLCLETGRTHQIRVHLSHIGCPIVGDYLYGQALPQLNGRFALHSAYLRCAQPVTGERVTCVQPLPPELLALLDE